ncbi:hypothetical protein V5799_007914 [Amblyomma americanum]|uniref:Uncharacterized protein n=1 Tax=Amblyomma americanum TaxID=6943 RepID=A0AAQ4FGI2_AMBAM
MAWAASTTQPFSARKSEGTGYIYPSSALPYKEFSSGTTTYTVVQSANKIILDILQCRFHSIAFVDILE